MNVTPRDKQIQVINALVEGCSIRSIERMYGVHRDTVTRLMIRTGQHCMTLVDDLIRDIPTGTYQIDELWTFVRKKDKKLRPHEKHDAEIGSQFIFVAMEAQTKLVPSWQIGKRVPEVAYGLLADLKERLNGNGDRATIITDGFGPYLDAVYGAFGTNVNFAQLIKVVSEDRRPAREGYIPAIVVRCDKTVVTGRPHESQISTSLIERQNLTLRTSMKRLARLTLSFSKKLDNLKAATALHFAYYNLCRIHRTIRVTPAMAAGLVNSVWEIGDLIPN